VEHKVGAVGERVIAEQRAGGREAGGSLLQPESTQEASRQGSSPPSWSALAAWPTGAG
jgi:hypothetical protein